MRSTDMMLCDVIDSVPHTSYILCQAAIFQLYRYKPADCLVDVPVQCEFCERLVWNSSGSLSANVASLSGLAWVLVVGETRRSAPGPEQWSRSSQNPGQTRLNICKMHELCKSDVFIFQVLCFPDVQPPLHRNYGFWTNARQWRHALICLRYSWLVQFKHMHK